MTIRETFTMYRFRGILFIIVAAVLFGMLPIWVKLSYKTGLTAVSALFLRSIIASVILGIIIYFKKSSFRIGKEQVSPLLLSNMNYAGAILTLYFSYYYVSSGVATSLHYLYPVIVMVVVCFIYRRKVKVQKWIALLLALFGIYIISEPWESSFSFIGVTLAACSALFFAIYTLSINIPQLKKLNSLVICFYTNFMMGIMTLFFFVVKGSWQEITLKGFYYTSLAAIFCTVIALILFVNGVKHIGSANASILCTLEPVVSMIAGTIFLRESLTFFTIIGCILIVVAVMIVGYSDFNGGIIEK